MKTITATALILGLLATPALARHPSPNGASDPATLRATLIAGATTSDDTVYGPGSAAPVRDGWG